MQSKREKMFLQQNSRPTLSASAMLLQEIERQREIGFPESNLMVEMSGNHSILCNEKLFVPHIDKNKPITWTFTVASSSRVGKWCSLRRVFTLDPYLPEYSMVEVNAIGHPKHILPLGCQEWENDIGRPITSYQITLRFESADYGSFHQRVVFDFHGQPYVFRQLGVVVAPELNLLHTIHYPVICEDDSELSWLSKYSVVPFDPHDTQVHGKSEFPLPPNLGTALEFGHFDHLEDSLLCEHYRQRLHMLLHIEEFERRRQMTRLTVHCTDLLHCKQQCASDPSQVTLVLPVQEDLMDDASLLISRGGYALVRVQPHGMSNPVLYEVVVESLRKNRVLLRASSELQKVLKSKRPLPASICFRFIDTYQHMHWAVENISLDIVFPAAPQGDDEQWSNHSDCNKLLNKSQMYALKQMLSPHPGPPLLILGPFGTGKTRTIAEAIKELISIQLHSQADYRILLCTHSNSAADHYIKNHLHPFLTESKIPASRFKPIRICWENRFVSTVSDVVLQYCLLDLNTGKFALPSQEVLTNHQIVVTTLVTAASLAKLNLPHGFFTHIFIDEAAQAMEAETIIPLCLAGLNSQIVLAGDHLQLSPPVMSEVCQRLALGRSLLVRLHELYPSVSRSKVLLLQNYRAYDDIVDVPSHLFYQDTLIANLKRPASLPYSVVFYGVHGQEEIADEPPSFLNRGEAAEVADRVEELIKLWPAQVWGNANPARICVLAPYPTQVREIRRLLRAKSLGGVQVEGVNNVQGLEFDVLFISTVRTLSGAKGNVTSQKNLGFLSDCKLLNTAITRARYRLVVIGDPVALCSVGECRVCWKTILSKCNSNGTFHYRLPFDTVTRMTRDAKNDRENNALQFKQIPSVSNAHRGSGSPCDSLANAAPEVLGSLFPRQPIPTLPANLPFLPIGPIHENVGLFAGRPIYPGNPGPFAMPGQALPFPMNSVPIIPNPFQQHPLNGFIPQLHLPQQGGLPNPLAPWPRGQHLVPNNSPVGVSAQQKLLQHMSTTQQTAATLDQPNLSHANLGGIQMSSRHQEESQQSKPLPDPTSPDGSLRALVLSLDSNLTSRKEMITKEKDHLNKLRASFHSPPHHALRENIQRQIRLAEKEANLLEDRIKLLRSLSSLAGSQQSENAHVGGAGDDDSERPNPSDSNKIYREDDFEDSDTEEWFSAQQKDPIVQDYIKAFETLTSRSDHDAEESLVSSETVTRDTSSPLSSEIASSCTSEGQDVSPLQGWILQPSESTVYIESYSINEEHLTKEEAQSKLAKDELVACCLQIDNFSDGNTAVAKFCDPDRHDIRINSRTNINRAFNGDIVAVEVINNKHQGSGDPQGKVVAILKEMHPRKVVCRLDNQDKNMMTPINRSNSKFVILQSRDHQGQTGVAVFAMRDGRIDFTSFVTETEGKLFLVQLMKWGASYRYPLGFVVHYFTEGGDPHLSIPILLAEHGIHRSHSKKIQNEAKRDFPPGWKIPEAERSKRMRSNDVFSIDPASCVEVDDALSVCWETDGTYKVGVHITDASFFVAKNSNLDKAALSHGTSVYGSPEVSYHNPMLPSYVSTELCSLLPDEERLAISIMFHLNEDGIELERPEIHRSVVTSCCKLTFDQCQDILDGKKADDVPESVQKGIGILAQLSFKMWARRVRQGYVSFESDVTKCGVLSSEKMVEEFMLQSNRTIAERLLQNPPAKTLVPLRRQLPPKTHLLRDIYDSCVKQGIEPSQFFSLQSLLKPSSDVPRQCGDDCVSLDLKTWETISGALDEKDLGKVTISILRHDSQSGVGKVLSRLASVQERSGYVVSSTLSSEMQRHFSLNVASYTHFTSPIRRYMDIVVHRILVAVLEGAEMPYTEPQVQSICEQCQMMTTRVDCFENQLAAVSRADVLRRDSKWRVAKVDCLTPDYLLLGGEEVDHVSSFNRNVRIHDCKPSSREWLEEEEELVLSWNILEINVTGQSLRAESSQEDGDLYDAFSSAKLEPSSGVARQFLKIPKDLWLEFLQQFRSEDLHQINQRRQTIDAKAVVAFENTHFNTSGNHSPEESIAMSSLALHGDLNAHTKFYRRGDAISVYLGAEMHRGLLRPTIMAVKFTDSILCCMRHRRHPTKSFGVPQMSSTKAAYSDVRDYQAVMLPLLLCEAATSSINSDSTVQVILQNVSVQWKDNVGQFTLSKTLCIARGLQLCSGDFICLRSHVSPYIFHYCVSNVDSTEERDLIQINLVEVPDGFSVDNLDQTSWLCSMEVIARGLSFRRMTSAVKNLGTATELIRSVILRRDIPKYLARNPRLVRQSKEDITTTLNLNPGQEQAVMNALASPLTLIQGPPGTGKTWTGVEIASQFAAVNRKQGNGGQVLFCAPSNHAVDVAARMLQTVPGVKVLRVYGRTIEDQTFKQSLRTNLSSAQSAMDKTCEEIALHFRIRNPSNPHSARVKLIEDEVMQLRKRTVANGPVKDHERNRKELSLKVQEFHRALDEAEGYEIAESATEVILCTCIEAGSSRVKRHARVSHVIIDEAGMCLEAESLVALSNAGQRLQQVVLLGDHKQLGAVIMSSAPRKLGLSKSLFEVLFHEPSAGKTYSSCMLQTQYRMHPSIKEFPSQHFYQGMLKDAHHLTSPEHVSVGRLPGFWPGGSDVRVVFCHVMGTEESPQDYTGPEGREESKHNPQEVEAVLRVVKYLMSHGVKSSQISVLTPYSAQRAKITRALQTSLNSCNSEVLSVFASQGAERDFVVLSTVRSLPREQLTGSTENQQWLTSHLGFLIDERQMNVALTRAKHGLVIIGNRHLLAVHSMWSSLITHCQRLECLVDETSWLSSIQPSF